MDTLYPSAKKKDMGSAKMQIPLHYYNYWYHYHNEQPLKSIITGFHVSLFHVLLVFLGNGTSSLRLEPYFYNNCVRLNQRSLKQCYLSL